MTHVAASAVLLTGTIGAGKTTLAEAISEALHEAGRKHALVDLDWLGQVYPPPDPDDPFSYDLALENLSVMWPNFLRKGIQHAVIAGTVERSDQLSQLRAALKGADLQVALVTAPPTLVAERIRKRDQGRLLADFLARTDALAATIAAASLHDLHIMNDDEIASAAKEVMSKLNW